MRRMPVAQRLNTPWSSSNSAPNITILEFHIAIDLITSRKLGHSSNRCIGAYVYNRKDKSIRTVKARFTAIATGSGASKVYLYTSNPR